MGNFSLGILGAGNMANAILSGIFKSNIVDPSKIMICDVDIDKFNSIKDKNICFTCDSKVLFDECDYVILAVKPQVARMILPTIDVSKGANVISIMAGITISKIKSMIGDVKVTRIMPNTPCLIGEGMCAIDCRDFDEEGKNLVTKVFSSLGKILFINEDLFDAVTAVSGSGPAYVYMFIKGMIDKGVNLGLDIETAKTLTLQTFVGSTKMVGSSKDNIDTLIKRVCSPGGTTIQAVNYYNDNNLLGIIAEGMEKCENRSKELSKDE